MCPAAGGRVTILRVTAATAIDPALQAKAKEYARVRRRLLLIDLVIKAAWTGAWLAFGWALALENGLSQLTTNPWLLVPLFAAVFFLSFEIFDLPLGYYSNFVLAHRYGQSTQSRAGWVKDEVLGLVLGAALGLPIIEAVYWLLRTAGDGWWLWAAAGYFVLVVVLSLVAPVLIMPLFNKFVPLGPEHAHLAERLRRLAARYETRVSGVFRFDMSKRTKAANAALTGIGASRRIVLDDTLLNEFTADEVETVIAHELGHHVHNDIPVGIVFSGLLALVGLYLAAAGLAWGATVLGFAGPADIGALPLLALIFGAFGTLTLPISNAYSRWREVRADEFALRATQNPAAFAGAMSRLANQNLAEADPEPWVVVLLHSHPPIRSRLAMAAAWPAAPTGAQA
jgi:STE24 endopeptidase